MMSSLQLWRDRRGRVSILRIGVLALFALPVVLACAAALSDGFWARPLNNLIHRSGYWALMFLLLSLAVTPLRRIARFGQLIDVRRMIGVGAFVYVAVHLGLFIADTGFDLRKVATEIALRPYLTIGFTALIGLSALAATSTDGMMRRLGGLRWRRLHRASYVITLLALVHFFQQTKADVSVPILTAGLFGWLMGYRLLAGALRLEGELPTMAIAGLSSSVAALTFLGEAVGIGLAFGVSPVLVLSAAFDIEAGIRPGWVVLAAGLVVVAIDAARSLGRPPRRAPLRPHPVLATGVRRRPGS